MKSNARFWFAPKENVYRDVWLLLISIVVLVTVSVAINAANSANRIAHEQQRQRYDAALLVCQQANERHHATIRELRHLVKVTPRRRDVTRAEERQSVRSTILLIDALVPTRDCDAYAHQIVPR